MAKKPRADSKLKNLPKVDQEHLWELLSQPQVAMSDEPGAPMRPFTLQELQTEVPLLHGFTVALSTLSEWRSWYALRLRTQSAMARADQAKLEWLKENPDATPEDLGRLGQMVFTAESIEDGNIKGFVALMRERNRQRAIELDHEKFRAGLKSDLEKGLDALFEEIKGNEKAEEIFRDLKETLRKS